MALQLGQGINLLYGGRGDEFGPGSLHLAGQQYLRLIALQPMPASSNWQELCVTVHDDVAGLVDRLWSCHVAPHRHDGAGFEVRPAALIDDADRAARTAFLSERLGIALAEGQTYLLLELHRTDGRADHEVTARPPRRFFDREWHLLADWRRAAARLRPGQRVHDGFCHDAIVTAAEAQCYVDAFYRFGTHFVSAVETGDRLVQLVALKPESARWITAYWRRAGAGQPVHGDAAMAFAAFLAPDHAREAGPILSLAGDPDLPRTLAQGAWNDAVSIAGVSLAAPFRSGSRRAGEVLAGFAASAAVHTELTSMALFTEFYRAINFERILRGALVQRWGDRVHLPVRRMPEFTCDVAIAAASPCPPVAGCRRVLRLKRGDGAALSDLQPPLAQLIDAAACSSHALQIRRADALFEQAPFACQTMAGVVILENLSGTRRDTFLDGLRFSSVPQPNAAEVRVTLQGDAHVLPPDQVPRLLPDIRDALLEVAAALPQAGPDEATRRAAAAFAGWLANCLAAAPPTPGIEPVRALAHYITAAAAMPLPDPLHLPAETCRALHDRFVELGSIAIEADEVVRDAQEAQAPEMVCPSSARTASGATPAMRLRTLRQSATRIWLEMQAVALPVAGVAGQPEHGAEYRGRMERWRNCVLASADPVFAAADPARLERLLLAALLGEALRLFQAALEDAGFHAPPPLPDGFDPAAIGFFMLQYAGSLRPRAAAALHPMSSELA